MGHKQDRLRAKQGLVFRNGQLINNTKNQQKAVDAEVAKTLDKLGLVKGV